MISGPRTMTVSETSLVGRLEIAEDALRRAGFRRCDSMACNCNSWHQVGGFRARFDEIKEAVEEAGFETNGKTLLGAVKGIIASALTAEAQRDGALTPDQREAAAKALAAKMLSTEWTDLRPFTRAKYRSAILTMERIIRAAKGAA